MSVAKDNLEGMGGFDFIDLCAGVGGLRIPFDEIGGRCVFTSEIDPQAVQTYSNNFNCAPGDIYGDITEVDLGNVPNHDILLAGFPCQPFSHAGKRKGFDDTRGTLFFYIASIARARKPKILVLENVRGLLNHDGGHTFAVIRATLEEIGYVVHWQVLNARDFGLPQNRQRLFIIAIRADLPSAQNYGFPAPTHDRDTLRVGDILESNPSRSLTISSRLWDGHQNRRARNKLAGKGFGYQIVDHNSPYTATLSARYYKDGSEILVHQVDQNPRLLSFREAARLQGFPENFAPHITKKHAYKQFGNAVPVNVVRAIAKSLNHLL